jgi:hypothetical protein
VFAEDGGYGNAGWAGAPGVYLVSPQGRKYEFYRSPTATVLPQFGLVDWSGDRRRILVYPPDAGRGPLPVEQISLATGTVISRFRLPGDALPDSHTRPAGYSLHIPGSAGAGDWIVTRQARWLLVESGLPAGGPGSLFWYSPATRSIRFVFRPPPGRCGVFDAIPYDSPSS